jgi:hypothetical protein
VYLCGKCSTGHAEKKMSHRASALVRRERDTQGLGGHFSVPVAVAWHDRQSTVLLPVLLLTRRVGGNSAKMNYLFPAFFCEF